MDPAKVAGNIRLVRGSSSPFETLPDTREPEAVEGVVGGGIIPKE